MRFSLRLGVALSAAALIAFATSTEAKALRIAGPPPKPSLAAGQADIVIIGKVVEVEKDTVEATPFKGAPKEQKQAYKIAVIKMEEAVLGGKGLTQFRVGFLADAAPVPKVDGPAVPGGGLRRPLPFGRGPVALTEGTEGCFFLSRHHGGDFYILANNGTAAPLLKKDDTYAKELDAVKKITRAIEDPVSALKAKELDDRYQAAQLILQRYQQNPTGGSAREAIPAEENKLILKLLMDLPWQPDNSKPRTGSDPVPPCRQNLWYMINPQEFGFKQPVPKPVRAGDPPVDFNKVLDEATTVFLKDNIEKIKIKRFAK